MLLTPNNKEKGHFEKKQDAFPKMTLLYTRLLAIESGNLIFQEKTRFFM